MNTFALLADEQIASIRDIQKNPSKTLRGITRVTRGSKTIGFFLSNEDFADLVENYEARSNPLFMKRIEIARRDMNAGKGVSLRAFMNEHDV